MLRQIQKARFVFLFAAAVAVMSAGARGEVVDASQWKFSISFPCKSQLSSQVIKTAVGDIVMTLYNCSDDKMDFTVAVNDYPAGSFTPDKVDAAYANVINAIAQAEQLKSTVRTVTPFTLGGNTGREALFDGVDGKSAVRIRVFIIGDRLYQTLVIGKLGQEKDRECLDFLNSFTLIGVNTPPATSPSPK